MMFRERINDIPNIKIILTNIFEINIFIVNICQENP